MDAFTRRRTVSNYLETFVFTSRSAVDPQTTDGRAVIQGSQFLTTPIHITPARASQSAIRAVEKIGGTVFCKYYNALAIRDCVDGRTDRVEAAPVRKNDIGMCHVFL